VLKCCKLSYKTETVAGRRRVTHDVFGEGIAERRREE
jgi:hypothetical protein